MHAATFIQAQEKGTLTRVNVNPFMLDIVGNKLDLPKSSGESDDAKDCPYMNDQGLLLKADLSTLRHC